MKKATKIIGVALGVLLVAALLTGGAAAHSNENTIGDVYVWELYDDAIFAGTEWSMGNETLKFKEDPTFPGKYYIGGSNIVEGTYSYTIGETTYKINVKYLSAAPAGIVYRVEVDGTLTPIADLADEDVLIDTTFVIAIKPNGEQYKFKWTNPAETLITTDPTVFGMEKYYTSLELAAFADIAYDAENLADEYNQNSIGASLLAAAIEKYTATEAKDYREVLAFAAAVVDKMVDDDFPQYQIDGAEEVLTALLAITPEVTPEKAFDDAKQAAVDMADVFAGDETQAKTLNDKITLWVDIAALYGATGYQEALTYDVANWADVEVADLKAATTTVIGAFTPNVADNLLESAQDAMYEKAVDSTVVTEADGASHSAVGAAGAKDAAMAVVDTLTKDNYTTVLPSTVSTAIGTYITGLGDDDEAKAAAGVIKSEFETLEPTPSAWSFVQPGVTVDETLVNEKIADIKAALCAEVLNQYSTTKTDADAQIYYALGVVRQLLDTYDVMEDTIDYYIESKELDADNEGVLAVKEAVMKTPLTSAGAEPTADEMDDFVEAAAANAKAAYTLSVAGSVGAEIVKTSVFSSAVTDYKEAVSAAFLAAENITRDDYADPAGYKLASDEEFAAAKLAGLEVAQAVKDAADKVTGPYAYAIAADEIADDLLITAVAGDLSAKAAWDKYHIACNTYSLTNVDDIGVYSVQSYIVRGDEGYSSVAPAEILGNPAYFEISKADTSKSLKALSDSVLQKGFITVELTAPYNTLDSNGGYLIGIENGKFAPGQTGMNSAPAFSAYLNEDCAWVGVDLKGFTDFVVQPTSTDNVKVKLYKFDAGMPQMPANAKVDKSLTIKVVGGAITADAASASTYIGNEIEISGINELGGTLSLFIKGPNYKFAPLKSIADGGAISKTPIGKVWDAKIDTGALRSDSNKRPDAGNYTIYIASLKDSTTKIETASDLDNSGKCNAYTTVVVALKQPFISITEAPGVVVKGDHLIVKGTAEGQPGDVMWYIFGTNYFDKGTATVDGDGVFEIDKPIDKDADMQAAQYFLVIQHKMYDKLYNVGPVSDGEGGFNIKKNESGPYSTGGSIIFNTNQRQSANAAQALCDALDDENIDDMYVKASFFIAGPSSVINAIPEQVVKGEALTISGVAVGHAKEAVSVELLSTAFAAVPKTTVGSASFVSATARVGEDGLWSITIDTTGLNADDYTASVAVGQLDPASKKIKIVEGSVTPQPTTQPTTQPTAQPTAQPTQTPASPGFGILAALAGLGAVAVLLLRRQ